MNGRKKGFILSFATLMIVATIVIVVFILGLAFSFIAHVKGVGFLEQEFTIVGSNQKAFFVAEALARLLVDDRLFFEHAIEAGFTGALDRSGSQSIMQRIAGFLEKYKEDYIRVRLGDDTAALADVSVIRIDDKVVSAVRCGEKMEGVCVPSAVVASEGCGTGYMPAADTLGTCPSASQCCKFDPAAYANSNRGRAAPIQRCGPGNIGICSRSGRISEGASAWCTPGDFPVFGDENNCPTLREILPIVLPLDIANNRAACCIAAENTDIAISKAKVPLVYGDGSFYKEIEVTIGER